MRSEQINELATALAKAQGEMKPALKDSINPHFKSKYADLASVWETIRAPLSRNGLSVTQTLGADPNNESTLLYTTLLHSSGQYVGSVQYLLPRDKTPQGLAAALTYARRQSLQAIVGVAADEDDDGNEASGRVEAPQKARFKEPVKPVSVSPLDYVPSSGKLQGQRLGDLTLFDLETYIIDCNTALERTGKTPANLNAQQREVYETVQKVIVQKIEKEKEDDGKI